MKKKVGLLYGNKIVVGDENSVTKNEILLKKKDQDSLEFSVRGSDGALKVISGGGEPEGEMISIKLYHADPRGGSNSSNITFINKEHALNDGRAIELPLLEQASQATTQTRDSGINCFVNPYMFFFNNSANNYFRKVKIFDPKNTFINKVDRCIEWQYLDSASKTRELDIVKDLDNHTIEITGKYYTENNFSDTNIILYDKEGIVLAVIGCGTHTLDKINTFLYGNPVKNAKPIDFSNTKGFENPKKAKEAFDAY